MGPGIVAGPESQGTFYIPESLQTTVSLNHYKPAGFEGSTIPPLPVTLTMVKPIRIATKPKTAILANMFPTPGQFKVSVAIPDRNGQ